MKERDLDREIAKEAYKRGDRRNRRQLKEIDRRRD